jgi:hypothetical protein
MERRFRQRRNVRFAAGGFHGGLQGFGLGRGQAVDHAADRDFLLCCRFLPLTHDAQLIGMQLLREPLRFVAIIGRAKITLRPGEEKQIGENQQKEE